MWIPAFAGMTVEDGYDGVPGPTIRLAAIHRSAVAARPFVLSWSQDERTGGGSGIRRVRDGGGWIPAFVGMTVGGGNDGVPGPAIRLAAAHTFSGSRPSVRPELVAG